MFGNFGHGRFALGASALLGAVALGVVTAGSAEAADKYKVYLSMSYVGNDFQAEASNMVAAMAKAMPDKVDLHIQASGPDAQKQFQQINAMVQAGANAIVVYPISPTALNGAIKNACSKGVVVFVYDSNVTEPCAYHVGTDAVTSGKNLAQFLVDELQGKGNVVMITGVPGTTVDADLQGGANSVFEKNAGIQIIAKANGMWSEPGARSELSKILATRSWDTIDGLWMETGCFTAAAMQMEAGIADDKIKPCASPSSNGQQVQMLPKEAADGTGPYRSFGYRTASASVPAMLGAYALKLAVGVLDGQKVERETVVDVPLITYKNSKLCEDGTWKEIQGGCTAFSPALVPPEFYSSIFNANTPEVALAAALFGEPEAQE